MVIKPRLNMRDGVLDMGRWVVKDLSETNGGFLLFSVVLFHSVSLKDTSLKYFTDLLYLNICISVEVGTGSFAFF